MSKRVAILEQFRQVIDGIASIKSTDVNRATPVDLAMQTLPAAFIYSSAEVRDKAEYQDANWNWDIVINIWGKDIDLEVFLEAIHTAVYAAYLDESIGALGDLCERVTRSASDMFEVDITRRLVGLAVVYQVNYNTANESI